MKTALSRSSGAVLLAFLLSFPAYGFSLTDTQVRNFIASFAEMQEMLDESYDEAEDPRENEEDKDFSPSAMISDFMTEIQGHELYGNVERLIRRHGFSGVNEWSAVGDRVMRAAFALEMGEHAPEMDEEMAEFMRNIEDNPHLDEAQKRQIINEMQAATESMAELAAAPEEDKDAVRPHMKTLRQSWGYMDDDY